MIASLIPESFFAARADALLWLLAAGAVGLLVLGADRAVTAAVKLASALGLSKVVIGATVVSLGTTSPEAFVSVNAAFRGNPGLAMGNGVGSIICDTALVFGLCCLLRPLPKDRFLLRRQGWLQFGSGALLTGTVLLLALRAGSFFGVTLPQWVGGIYLALLVGYLYLSVRWSRQHPEMIPDEVKAAVPLGPRRVNVVAAAIGNLAMLVIGLSLVVFGSELMIGSTVELCERLGVSEAMLAVTVVALGTSLPELVTALAAVIKGHPALLVGNVIGADVLNVLFVIGASATAVPLRVDVGFFWLYLPVMMLVLTLLRVFIFWPGETFRRWQGVPLLLAYAGFVALVLRYGVLE